MHQLWDLIFACIRSQLPKIYLILHLHLVTLIPHSSHLITIHHVIAAHHHETTYAMHHVHQHRVAQVVTGLIYQTITFLFGFHRTIVLRLFILHSTIQHHLHVVLIVVEFDVLIN